ncbi:translation initiation factor eIF-2B subunit epsilon [Manduca sexta]|uniref:translation initiation factor eIF-2B subunit epsilon n=1 Tax=Manduca sexta TaxID=7130 RepID=UPI00188ED924|nr:translation initiation factor eIF-2B subunit epsilon [Manduca sexta]XP_030032332.2 translation initiation factor eIF-2B subunit epsilon [Manduca sexta]XP_037297190.1 translation initiation factor eIF-2B subunit epsilon [Manduca sexta]XP_037297191.1 translation initiation factor eIF-2B subunit epsilon [Manduca sexta]
MEIDNENVIQAVIIMDTFNNNFNPICNDKAMGFLQVAGVPLIDYVLESLALGGVDETILFCCQYGNKIKEYVKECKENKASWSLTMDVQVMMSDTCQTMGDVMRELDAAALLKGYFILAGVNSISNIHYATLMEQHKQTCKKDKGAAMTLIYKKLSWEHPLISSDKPLFLVANGNTNKVLMHQKYKQGSKEKTVSLPLDIILNHSEVKLHHDLADTNIALCSPTVPPLFSDNFDFQTRDDFIHGILINEEILASSLYYILLKSNQYAATVSNWRTYQIISRDILHNWAYPLSIVSGSYHKNKYIVTGMVNFVDKTATLSRSCVLVEDVLIGPQTHIHDNTVVSKSIIGKNCVIGNNVTIKGCHLMDNIVVKENCTILNSFIDSNCEIKANASMDGAIIALNVTVEGASQLTGSIIESSEKEKEKTLLKSTSESGTEWEESSGSGDEEIIGFHKTWSSSESCYSSDSSAESILPSSPIPDDTNIFLQEVIDSLARGYEEKLKCDYLILEINSSRYAYNIQLHEVNFFVVKALLSIPVISQNKNILGTIKDILKYFRPVLNNYIKTKSSIFDCLRAIEDSCIKCEWLENRAGQIVHLFYEADVVDEDSLIEWHDELKESESPIANQTSIVKFFDWLQEASEESEDSD